MTGTPISDWLDSQGIFPAQRGWGDVTRLHFVRSLPLDGKHSAVSPRHWTENAYLEMEALVTDEGGWPLVHSPRASSILRTTRYLKADDLVVKLASLGKLGEDRPILDLTDDLVEENVLLKEARVRSALALAG